MKIIFWYKKRTK